MTESEVAIIPADMPLGLDHTILQRLENYEDYLSFYIQLEEASGVFAWLRADTLYQMAKKLGENSLHQLAIDLRQSRSTVINYVRTARAFPHQEREPMVSFSSHFQASFADSYDEKTEQFKTNTRFEWIKKAADEGMSTRKLQKQIKEKKAIAAGADPIVVARNIEIEDKVSALMHYLGALKDKAKIGDENALSRILGIYTTIYGEINKNFKGGDVTYAIPKT